MAISCDTIYQRVLSLANKEQRGYITPQEFNLFANMAQIEILEQYFYDYNQFTRAGYGNNTQYSDMASLLREKISYFEEYVTATLNAYNGFDISGVWKLGSVYNDDVTGRHLAYEVDFKEFARLDISPLTRPTFKRPVYYVANNEVIVSPSDVTDVFYSYIKEPEKVEWGYVVINEKALHNPATSTDFELPKSDSNELVYKILTLAGISIKREETLQAAQLLEVSQTQQQKQ
jgi:hypothetical protein|tara:strand:+ start:125 stop:820 length:696 start_codon:yes stop_codon:yes gene_type:complete